MKDSWTEDADQTYQVDGCLMKGGWTEDADQTCTVVVVLALV
jgi:hypothetical protein